jgi:hypothetical protein
MASRLAWTGIFIVCSAGFLVHCLTGPDCKTWKKYMQERKRAQELEVLLVGTLRFGCDRMEDYQDQRDAGLSLKDLTEPNIKRRRLVEKEEMEKRFSEGRPTEQDLQCRTRCEVRRKQREEWEKRTEDMRRRRERVDVRFEQIRRLIEAIRAPLDDE